MRRILYLQVSSIYRVLFYYELCQHLDRQSIFLISLFRQVASFSITSYQVKSSLRMFGAITFYLSCAWSFFKRFKTKTKKLMIFYFRITKKKWRANNQHISQKYHSHKMVWVCKLYCAKKHRQCNKHITQMLSI